METNPHKIPYVSLIVTLFMGICLVAIGVVYTYQENGFFSTQKEPTSAVRTPVTSVTPSKQSDTRPPEGGRGVIRTTPAASTTPMIKVSSEQGSLFSVITDATSTARVNELVTFSIAGSSRGKSPIGYDALVVIEPSAGGSFNLVEVKSLISDFSIFKFVKNDRITLTGILKLGSSSSRAWDGTPIAAVTFKPLSPGKYTIKILDASGKETSKVMVDAGNASSEKLISASSTEKEVDIAN